ncbi:MAG: hypothetical protein ABI566_13575 [Pseudolysinimonas sp.]
MDILSDYRITALLVSERELAQRAERARIAVERAEVPVARTTATGALICVPSTSH